LTPLFNPPKNPYIRGDTGGGRGTPLWWGVDVGGFANQIQKSITGEHFLWNLPNKLFPVPSVPEKKLSYMAKKV